MVLEGSVMENEDADVLKAGHVLDIASPTICIYYTDLGSWLSS
jgi:hypothetical protein